MGITAPTGRVLRGQKLPGGGGKRTEETRPGAGSPACSGFASGDAQHPGGQTCTLPGRRLSLRIAPGDSALRDPGGSQEAASLAWCLESALGSQAKQTEEELFSMTQNHLKGLLKYRSLGPRFSFGCRRSGKGFENLHF